MTANTPRTAQRVRSFDHSLSLLQEAKHYLASGVASSVRLGARPHPLYFERGEGSKLFDVDGNELVDFVMGWGPLIFGHSPPRLLDAVTEALQRGQTFGAQSRSEVSLARQITEVVPGAERVLFNTTGTEAVMSALRLARAFTTRTKIVKFEGHFHGWSDGIFHSVAPLANEFGDARRPDTVPGTAGIAGTATKDVIVLPWDDLEVVEEVLATGDVAAVVTEPYAFNTGIGAPEAGFLEGLRSLTTRYGALLIFDEVITGFRVALGGAQERLGVTADLAIFGKALAGGFPLSAVTGPSHLMEMIATQKVRHLGTFNGNIVGTAAGDATVRILREGKDRVYEELEAKARNLASGLKKAADSAQLPMLIQRVGSILYLHFTSKRSLRDYRDTVDSDRELYARFVEELAYEGVHANPRGLWYVSTAHSSEDISFTIEAARSVMQRLAKERESED